MLLSRSEAPPPPPSTSPPSEPRAVVAADFEPFFTTKPTGTGLGLPISVGIVEGLGGRLSAGNRNQGGATFRITLPASR